MTTNNYRLIIFLLFLFKTPLQPQKIRTTRLREVSCCRDDSTTRQNLHNETPPSCPSQHNSQKQARRTRSAPPVISHPLITDAFTTKTQAVHAGLLEDLVGFTGGTNRTATITPTDVARYLEFRRAHPRRQMGANTMKWTTIDTIYGNIIGALRDAKIYGYNITYDPHSPEFKRLGRSLTKRAQGTVIDFPTPANYNDIDQALRLLNFLPEPQRTLSSRYLLTWWITAARPNDAMALHSKNTEFRPNGVSYKFLQGKGVTLRGPYTVHTAAPKRWEHHLAFTGELVPPHKRDFIHKVTMDALHTVNRSIEARSIRRGSLQTLAKTGATDDTLMMFSGHTNVQMLHRYLDWGMQAHSRRNLGTQCAKEAWNPGYGQDGNESTTY